MRENDARRLTHNELTELRKRGVYAVQDGQPPKMVAKVLGIQRSTLFGWLARYRRGGWDALDARKRGGRPPKLTAKMLEWIYNTVTMKDPRQMKFPFALWTSLMVAELIRRQFGINLSKASVCRRLNQLGLTLRSLSGELFNKTTSAFRNGLMRNIRRFVLWRESRRRTFSLVMKQGCVPTFTRAKHGRFVAKRRWLARPVPVSAAI